MSWPDFDRLPSVCGLKSWSSNLKGVWHFNDELPPLGTTPTVIWVSGLGWGLRTCYNALFKENAFTFVKFTLWWYPPLGTPIDRHRNDETSLRFELQNPKTLNIQSRPTWIWFWVNCRPFQSTRNPAGLSSEKKIRPRKILPPWGSAANSDQNPKLKLLHITNAKPEVTRSSTLARWVQQKHIVV